MITREFADRFAAEWIEAWNAHDIARVLSHYADDFEMSSPVIIKLLGDPSGSQKGREAVGAYWSRALQLFPQLRFELIATLAGVNSIVLYYHGVSGPVAEVFQFDHDGKVKKASAHYV